MARRSIAAWLLAGALVSLPARAEDPPQDYATARALYNEGLNLEESGDFTGALARYRGAWASLKTPRTGYALARSLAHERMLVEAFDVASATARLPEVQGESREAKKDRAAAEKLASELKARIPSLRVVVRGAQPNARIDVRVDGVLVPQEVIALARKVDPGTRRVAVSNGDGAPVEITVTLAEGEERLVTVDAPPAPPSVPPPRSPATPPPEAPSSWTTMRTLAVVTAGVGAAALATGTVFGIRAKTLYDDASSHCLGTICDGDGLAKTDDAHKAARTSTVLVASGAGLVAVGAVLWLASPRASSVAVAPSFCDGPCVLAGATW